MPESVPSAASRFRPEGPTATGGRSLAPDLARGVMLLVIALANVAGYLHGRELVVGSYPAPDGMADQVVTLAQTTLVTGRGYPLFAALFGYGIVQLSRRQVDAGAGTSVAVTLIRRRGWWLIGFGFVHALLLWAGDILAAYGVLAVALAGLFLRISDRMLFVLTAGALVVTAVGGAANGVPAPEGQDGPSLSTSQADPLLAAVTRLTEWAPSLILQPLGMFGAVLLGVWAARRRLLEEPQRHRGLLTRVAVIGLGLAIAGGLPMAFMAASLWEEPPVWLVAVVGSLHYVTGYGGLGYAALIALITIRLVHRRGPVVTALGACGQRSLTCYLLQSVVFVTLLAAYGGGLGEHVSITAAAMIAAATWMLTVVVAEFMRRRQNRGPAEILLRRLSYSHRTSNISAGG